MDASVTPNTKVFAVPKIAPLMIVLMSDKCQEDTYIRAIVPKSET
jgi:hypothetical protein